MVTIGVCQSLIDTAIYTRKCWKKFYKYAGKSDVQKQYKAIIESDIVLTPERITKTIPTEMATSGITKNSSAKKNFINFLAYFMPNRKLLSSD